MFCQTYNPPTQSKPVGNVLFRSFGHKGYFGHVLPGDNPRLVMALPCRKTGDSIASPIGRGKPRIKSHALRALPPITSSTGMALSAGRSKRATRPDMRPGRMPGLCAKRKKIGQFGFHHPTPKTRRFCDLGASVATRGSLSRTLKTYRDECRRVLDLQV